MKRKMQKKKPMETQKEMAQKTARDWLGETYNKEEKK